VVNTSAMTVIGNFGDITIHPQCGKLSARAMVIENGLMLLSLGHF